MHGAGQESATALGQEAAVGMAAESAGCSRFAPPGGPDIFNNTLEFISPSDPGTPSQFWG